MRLYLDDVRPTPEGYDLRAYSSEEAKKILSDEEISFASLDHDLYMRDYNWSNFPYGMPETGHDVVKYMVEHNIWPPEGLRIHTDYAHGRENMMELVDEHGPYTKKEYGRGNGTEGITVNYS